MVTDEDREKAHGLLYPGTFADRVELVAAALAEEREKAEGRAYSEGAADALYGATAELLPHETVRVAYLRAESDRIRRELEGS